MRGPCGHRMGPARKSSMFFISYGTRTGPCRTRKGAVRQPYRHVRELTQPELAKLPHGRRIWPYGALTGPTGAVHGLFTICKHVRGPLAYSACIKTLRAPYGEAKFVLRHTGPMRVPWMDVRFLFKTAREQPVRGPGVWCDWGISGWIVDQFSMMWMN